MMKVFRKMGGKTMLLRAALTSLVCMGPDPALLADKGAVMSPGSKVSVHDMHSSMWLN